MDSRGTTIRGKTGAAYELELALRETADMEIWTVLAPDDATRIHGLLAAVRKGDDPLFETETVALCALADAVKDSPVTATVDYGTTPDARPFAILRVPAGDSLDHHLEELRGTGMPATRVRLMGEQLVRALELLHSRNLVHGDVRPSYVRFTADDAVRLMRYPRRVPVDGMRVIRRNKVILGRSPSEMIYGAPEVHAGQPRTVRADVFGLGAVLFEMLAGAPPFPIRSQADINAPAQRIAFGPAPSLMTRLGALSDGMRANERLVQRIDVELSRALHPEADLRHATPGELWRALDPLLAQVADAEPAVPSDRSSLPPPPGRVATTAASPVAPAAGAPAPQRPGAAGPRVWIIEPKRQEAEQDRADVLEPPIAREALRKVAREQAVPGGSASRGWAWRTHAPYERPHPILAAAFDPDVTCVTALSGGNVWRCAGGAWRLAFALPTDVGRAARALALLPNGHVLLVGERGLAWRTSADGSGYLWPTRDGETTFRGCHFDPHDGIITVVGSVRTQGIVVKLGARDVVETHRVANTNALVGVTRLAGGGPRLVCGDRGVLVRVEEGITLHMGFPCNGELLAATALPLPAGGACVVGRGGHALHVSDTYATTLEPVQTTKDIVAVNASEDGAVFATTMAGRLLRRSPEGGPWLRISPDLGHAPLDFVALGARRQSVTAVAANGVVVHGWTAGP